MPLESLNFKTRCRQVKYCRVRKESPCAVQPCAHRFVHGLNFQHSTSNIQNRTSALDRLQAPAKQANRP